MGAFTLAKIALNLQQLRWKQVMVIGDVMVDIYDFCNSATSRNSPEKPDKKVYTAQHSIKALGGAGNVASNLASLDIPAILLSVTGNDGNAFTAGQLAEKNKIAYHFIQDESRHTTSKTRLYIDDEYQLRRDDESTNEISAKISIRLVNRFEQLLAKTSALIISDYNKGVFTSENSKQIISACQKRKIPIIVDFKPPHRHFFAGADILVPNQDEAEHLQPGFNTATDLTAEVFKLYNTLDCKNIAVTLGKDGICGYDGKDFFLSPAFKVRETDVVGCGDTVRVGLALGFLAGLSLEDSAKLANLAAAVVVQKIGTATLSQEELLQLGEKLSAF